ncbi:protein shisa-5 isoform X1 [Cuculus canorus]|uniref:protein shisa-5 isoform X1 n=2 Tax=Cuculus canorus TaxID=55661 RepID=UPI0023AB20A4|nr:protein shisa-5 isoform X1 [Cuculus canorus]XP_053932283.1 protein shisa-5 isoform X1 [Cuculus canorus]
MKYSTLSWCQSVKASLANGKTSLKPPALGEFCPAYIDHHGKAQPADSCPIFCCGDCLHRYCCSNVVFRFNEEQLQCNLLGGWASDLSYMNDIEQFFQDPGDDISSSLSFGTLIAIGITVCAVIIITFILCLTCSCCCLYKACRRPRPVVTTTTSTTVVHAPYPQPQGVPPNYPVAPYQGYEAVAIQPQPGMPVAPYPVQYPPPYPMQPPGPPAYHETMAAGSGAPYPISQPPYNPAYMDPQKPTY